MPSTINGTIAGESMSPKSRPFPRIFERASDHAAIAPITVARAQP